MLKKEILITWTELKAKIKLKNQQLIQTQAELQQEKGWWDKWFSERERKRYGFSEFPEFKQIVKKYVTCPSFVYSIKGDYTNTNSGQEMLGINENEQNYGTRKIIKALYEYYRDK